MYFYWLVCVDGRFFDDIFFLLWLVVFLLMCGYLRLGVWVCGELVYDLDFGVGDFCLLLDKDYVDM